MKLAEALNERAHISQRLQELKERIKRNSTHQEGEEPTENPIDLLKEFNQCSSRFYDLVIRINQTNNGVSLSDGMPLVEALAVRESLKMKHSFYRSLALEAIPKQSRYSHSEIKIVSAIQVTNLQGEADKFAKEYRELDGRIQQSNWTNDLV